uniref:Uncharacterized protein n=1 Tax=Glossina austeni TaxID=7395 RepID=A0A1A9V5K1_GLOAU
MLFDVPIHRRAKNMNETIAQSGTNLNGMIRYWSDLLTERKGYDSNATTLLQDKGDIVAISKTQRSAITLNEIQLPVQDIKNWRAAGHDCIHNGWLKKLTCTHTTVGVNIGIDLGKCEMVHMVKGKAVKRDVGRVIDNIVEMLNGRKYILHETKETGNYRTCNATGETIEYVIRGCPILSSTEYLSGHYKGAKIISMAMTNKNALRQLYYRHRSPTCLGE